MRQFLGLIDFSVLSENKLRPNSEIDMKQEILEILVWKHFNQEAMADLEQAKSPRARREVIKTVLGLEKKEWRNKGTSHNFHSFYIFT